MSGCRICGRYTKIMKYVIKMYSTNPLEPFAKECPKSTIHLIKIIWS